jgi:hypothetical protein
MTSDATWEIVEATGADQAPTVHRETIQSRLDRVLSPWAKLDSGALACERCDSSPCTCGDDK